jgi:HPt (histidine-containing phosphotransfer) domain-containing protein
MRDPIVVEVESDLEELIPLFLEQRRKDVAAMAQALESGDFEALRVTGHGMAGAGERAARARDFQELKKQSLLLADFMERVVVKYV